MLTVEKITKEKTARIIPNAVGISLTEEKHVFGSLMSRDNTYRYMIKVWEAARTASAILVEPEIVVSCTPLENIGLTLFFWEFQKLIFRMSPYRCQIVTVQRLERGKVVPNLCLF